MTPSTRALCHAMIRLGKGALAECEKWVQAQPVSDHRATRTDVCDNAGQIHRDEHAPASPPR